MGSLQTAIAAGNLRPSDQIIALKMMAVLNDREFYHATGMPADYIRKNLIIGNVGMEMAKADRIGGCLALASLTSQSMYCVVSVMVACAIDMIDGTDSDDIGAGYPLKAAAESQNLFTAVEEWGKTYYPEYAEENGGGGFMPWWGSAGIVGYVTFGVNMGKAIPSDVLNTGWAATFGSADELTASDFKGALDLITAAKGLPGAGAYLQGMMALGGAPV
jgi:hypothetical protein